MKIDNLTIIKTETDAIPMPEISDEIKRKARELSNLKDNQDSDLEDKTYAEEPYGFIKLRFPFIGEYLNEQVGTMQTFSGYVNPCYVVGRNYSNNNKLDHLDCNKKKELIKELIHEYSTKPNKYGKKPTPNRAVYWWLDSFGILYAGEGKRRVHFMKEHSSGNAIYVEEINKLKMPKPNQISIISLSPTNPRPETSFLLIKDDNNDEHLYPIIEEYTIDFMKLYSNNLTLDIKTLIEEARWYWRLSPNKFSRKLHSLLIKKLFVKKLFDERGKNRFNKKIVLASVKLFG
ncbi:hypothetical protein [Neisseria weaveri]|uniref:Uncharacterized protein n=1 Tax=Neisseria weaveri TaxID=28091 RepID=A0A448VP87_9NEIS|nr:hypothetical protein [Neisseria weaveri]EGV38923.1 hypothetical protein l11_00020 [Neisseria weaveri LMG 5135]VEJ51484.1 Uncharacterised protein [Neisseria weaveri]